MVFNKKNNNTKNGPNFLKKGSGVGGSPGTNVSNKIKSSQQGHQDEYLKQIQTRNTPKRVSIQLKQQNQQQYLQQYQYQYQQQQQQQQQMMTDSSENSFEKSQVKEQVKKAEINKNYDIDFENNKRLSRNIDLQIRQSQHVLRSSQTVDDYITNLIKISQENRLKAQNQFIDSDTLYGSTLQTNNQNEIIELPKNTQKFENPQNSYYNYQQNQNISELHTSNYVNSPNTNNTNREIQQHKNEQDQIQQKLQQHLNQNQQRNNSVDSTQYHTNDNETIKQNYQLLLQQQEQNQKLIDQIDQMNKIIQAKDLIIQNCQNELKQQKTQENISVHNMSIDVKDLDDQIKELQIKLDSQNQVINILTSENKKLIKQLELQNKSRGGWIC